jgi:beta-galactosidase/beta-glucuronidase
MLKQILHDNWSVRAVGDLSEVPSEIRDDTFPANVPGCVHTDLLRAGKIPDPYLDLNEYKLQWIGQTDWEYRSTFDADAKLFDHERIDLVFDGLDTVARIELNGAVVGETQNMHRSYRFDVRKHLKRGSNELRVKFASAVKYAFAMREKLGHRPWVNGAGGPFNFIRKMACNFGWDWGPVLVTCGIWKGVRVEGWRHLRISKIVPTVTHCNNQRALVAVRVEIEGEASDRCDLGVTIAARSRGTGVPPVHSRLEPQSHGRDAHATKHQHANPMVANAAGFSDRTGAGEVIVEVNNPHIWQPAGHGMQALYELIVEAHDFSSTGAHDVTYQNIGLRTVELDTAPDSIGSKFVLKVNGKPVFCKGFNWIPDDCFLDRACDPARVRKRIQQAVDAGANMLRVWGGGIYETDDFYNICDELGVMVWQDFPFACAMYPEEEPFKSEVEAEARENVARLSSHPSLVLWNGNNENLWAYRDWGWKDQVAGKTWGKNYYLDVLPKIVKELDPSRPYWAASPWSGDTDVDNGIHPNDANHGNKHVWEAWFKEDYSSYRKFAPRFCSEFGFQAPANYATIVRAVLNGQQSSFSPRAHAGSDAEREERSRDEPRVGAGAKRGKATESSSLDFGSIQLRHRQKSGNVHDDGDLRNLRHHSRHFKLDGLDDLIQSLTVPEPRPALPPPGTVQPLHAASKPSNVDFDDLHYLLQLNQCRALTLGVEWFRSRQPTCMGTLYWQLNDCWPVTSWSCIDGDGRLKPLWYATRRFYAPRLLTIQPAGPDYKIGDPLWLFAINDSDEPWRYTTRVTLEDFLGIPISESIVKFDVPPRSVVSQALSSDVVTPLVEAQGEVIVAHGDSPAMWFFLPDKLIRYPSSYCTAEIQTIGEAHRVTLRARHLVRDIILAVDRIDPDATIDDNCITLLPNEPRTLTIHCRRPIDAKTLMKPPVFQCANRFGSTKWPEYSEET